MNSNKPKPDYRLVLRNGEVVGYVAEERGYGRGERWRWHVNDHPTDAWSDTWAITDSFEAALEAVRLCVGDKPVRPWRND